MSRHEDISESPLAASQSQGENGQPAVRPLRGIGTLNVAPDQVLVHARALQAELARLKCESFRSGNDSPDPPSPACEERP